MESPYLDIFSLDFFLQKIKNLDSSGIWILNLEICSTSVIRVSYWLMISSLRPTDQLSIFWNSQTL